LGRLSFVSAVETLITNQNRIVFTFFNRIRYFSIAFIHSIQITIYSIFFIHIINQLNHVIRLSKAPHFTVRQNKSNISSNFNKTINQSRSYQRTHISNIYWW